MKKQEWFCEKCGAKESVMIDSDADVYSVVNEVRFSHESKAPKCSARVHELRIVNMAYKAAQN